MPTNNPLPPARPPQAYPISGGMGLPQPPTGLPVQPTGAYAPLAAKPIDEAPGAQHLALGLIVGLALAVVFGFIFGTASIQMNVRFGLINIVAGYAIGYAVLKACKEGGSAPGMIAGCCALGACLIGQYIIYHNYVGGLNPSDGTATDFFSVTTAMSPLNWVFMVYAFWRGYRIASG